MDKKDILFDKSKISDFSTQDQRMMNDLQKKTLEYMNYKIRMEGMIEQKKKILLNHINKGLNNPNAEIKMYAANLYNQINN